MLKITKQGNTILLEDGWNWTVIELDPRDVDLPDGVIKPSDLKYTNITGGKE